MAIQKFNMFICKDISEWGAGKVSLNDFNLATSCGTRPSDYLLIGETVVEVDVPEIDTRTLEIQALEKSIQSERAQSQVRVNILLDRISKLKAIGHEVIEG